MVAAVVEIGADGRIARARVAVGACSEVAQRLAGARGGPRGPAAPRPRRPRSSRPEHLAGAQPDRRRPRDRGVPARRARSCSFAGPSSGAGMTARTRGRDGVRSRSSFSVNGAPASVARRPDAPPVRRPPRRPRPDRHEGRLRGRRLRRVHGPARRPPGRVVPGARRRRSAARDDHDGRGPRPRRRTATPERPPGGVPRRTAPPSAGSARRACSWPPTRCSPRTPTPTTRAIRDGIGGVLCRCTGYVKIVEAIAATRDARPAAARRTAGDVAALAPAAGRGGRARASPKVDGLPRVLGHGALRRRRAARRASSPCAPCGRRTRERDSRSATSAPLRARYPGLVDVLTAARRARPEPLRHLPDRQGPAGARRRRRPPPRRGGARARRRRADDRRDRRRRAADHLGAAARRSAASTTALAAGAPRAPRRIARATSSSAAASRRGDVDAALAGSARHRRGRGRDDVRRARLHRARGRASRAGSATGSSSRSAPRRRTWTATRSR